MRIISGTKKGFEINYLKNDKIRPTSDKVRMAVFNMLFEVENKIVLDLFSGTGSYGFEALSRNAKHCYFNDNNFKQIKLIKSNIKLLNFEEKSTLLKNDFLKTIDFLRINKKIIDLIFIDPPFKENKYYNLCFEQIPSIINNDSIIVVEKNLKNNLEIPNNFLIYKNKIYGDIEILLIKQKEII